MGYYIRDTNGWWCGQKRNSESKMITLWAPERDKRGEMHFAETAERIAAKLPQETSVVFIDD